MQLLYKLKYCKTCSYDLIAVGTYAQKVAKVAAEFSNQNLKVLTFGTQKTVVEPSLLPFSITSISVSNHHQNSQGENSVISRIIPQQKKVITSDGNVYDYRFMIYSGEPQEWRNFDTYPGLTGNLNINSSFVYGDDKYFNYSELYQRRMGTIVFVLPKGRHFGYENYFMVQLKNIMAKQPVLEIGGLKNVRIVVLNQDSALSPFNTEHERFLKQLFQQNRIEYFNNAQILIDYNVRKIQLKGSDVINYDALFHYFPMKVPQILAQARIDPFQNNMHTLQNNQFPNFYVLGNVFPTPISLHGIKEMSEVMGINIAYKLSKIQKQVLFTGTTACDIWLNENEVKTIRYGYNHNGKINLQRFGDSKIGSIIEGTIKKVFAQSSAIKTINRCRLMGILPERYFETISTNQSLLPMVIHQ